MAKSAMRCLLLALGPHLLHAQSLRYRVPPSPKEMEASMAGDWSDWGGESSGWATPRSVLQESQWTYDCFIDYADWQVKWSESKKMFCCTHESRGCSSGPFDCEQDFENWERAWSDDKKAWCCGSQKRGCSIGDRLFDCEAGLENKQWAWIAEKQAWCCSTQSIGCTTTAKPLFDCQAIKAREILGVETEEGGDDAVDIEMLAWCCEHESIGCPTTTVTEATTQPKTTSETASTSSKRTKTTTVTTTSSATTTTSTATSTITSTTTTATATITSTTTTTPVMVIAEKPTKHYDIAGDGEASGQGALEQALMCAEREVTWEPLDMANQSLTVEKDIAACQARCASIPECAHYSFWTLRGHCHLQSAFATRQSKRRGFVAGPPSCRKVEDSLATLTILAKRSGCFSDSTAYIVMDMSGEDPTQEETVTDCQARCAREPSCAHFTYHMWSRTCHISDAGAQAVSGMVYHVAGPPVCQGTVSFRLDLDNLLYSELMRPTNDNVLHDIEEAIKGAVRTKIGGELEDEDIFIELSEEQPQEMAFRMRKLALPTNLEGGMAPRVIVKVTVRPPASRANDGVADSLASAYALNEDIAGALRRVQGLYRVAAGDVSVSLVRDIAFKSSDPLIAQQKFQARGDVARTPLQPTLFAAVLVAALAVAVCAMPVVVKRVRSRAVLSMRTGILHGAHEMPIAEDFGTETIPRLPAGSCPLPSGYGPVGMEL